MEENPYIELLENILLNDPKNVDLPKKLDYLQTSFLKIDSYRKTREAISKEILEKELTIRDEHDEFSLQIKKEEFLNLWPGDRVHYHRSLRMFNTHTYLQDEKDFRRKSRRSSYPQGFEKHSNSLFEIVQKMIHDNY